MIAKLSGQMDSIQTQTCILNVHDIGYLISTPQRTLAKLSVGEKKTFSIHTHVREDTLDLFGFETKEELDLFKLLLTVSGIGPKTALLVIDKGVQEIRSAITKGDVSFFTGISRLGTKNAQKIIIELKNKLGSVSDLDLSETAQKDVLDVTDALSSMGFRKVEIIKAMKYITDKEKTIEEKIKVTLKHLSK